MLVEMGTYQCLIHFFLKSVMMETFKVVMAALNFV
jgi:hypothetical protein